MKMKRTALFLSLYYLLVSLQLQSQQLLDADQYEDIDSDYLEDVVKQINEDEVSFQQIDYYEHLFPEDLGRNIKKLNINKAEKSAFIKLGILDTFQINSILEYRKHSGPFVALFELQVLDGFSVEDLQRVLPYLTVGNDLDAYHGSLDERLLKGKNEWTLAWNRYLEKAEGYRAETSEVMKFEGSPDRILMKYKHYQSKHVRFGMTAEKDAGESFFSQSNKHGFDFISAHLHIANLTPRIKTLVLGDFVVSMGQGLIMHAGYGGNKSAMVNQIKKTGPPLKSSTSTNESVFLRGGGALITIRENVNFLLFYSQKKEDANVLDSLSEGRSAHIVFTSLLQSGLHRNRREIDKENQINWKTIGSGIHFQRKRLKFEVNALFEHLNPGWQRDEKPYNQFFFQGKNNHILGIGYSYIHQNFHFFGEAARSKSGGISALNGLFIGLDQSLEMVVLQRYLSPNYHSLQSNIFSETNQGNNERGFYMGIIFTPTSKWRWASYFDHYRHPWLRFQTDSPSRGFDIRSRLTYTLRKKLTFYAEYRYEKKEVNMANEGQKTKPLGWKELTQLRLHFAQQLFPPFEWRSRIQFGYQKKGGSSIKGIQIQQDILFKPKTIPLSFTARYAVFDTEGYDIRFYSYENGLLHQFAIPPYFDVGSRFYVNIRYKGIRNTTLEARIARFQYLNLEEIGTGVNSIAGSKRTEVAFQLTIKH